jgi:CO dehydrogenase/acetyl-CoA synthase epsilon subunit
MRTTNLEHLNFWLSQNGQLAKEDLSHMTRIKFFTLDKIIRGVRNASDIEQVAICKATGLKRDDLFPIAQAITA